MNVNTTEKIERSESPKPSVKSTEENPEPKDVKPVKN